MKTWIAITALFMLLVGLAFLRRGPLAEDPSIPCLRTHVETSTPLAEFEVVALPAVEDITVEEAPKPPSERIGGYRAWLTETLVRIARLQNPDGSWGDGLEPFGDHWIDRTGMTALALLVFHSHLENHLSSDDYDGQRLGMIIKNGLKWLMARQSASGGFGGSCDLDEILATLAMSEAYGATATQLLKEPAQRAIDALARNFLNRSGWPDDIISAWSARTIFSARHSELEIDETFLGISRLLVGDEPDTLFKLAEWGLLQEIRPVDALRRVAQRPDFAVEDAERNYFAAAIVHLAYRPHGTGSNTRSLDNLIALYEIASNESEKPVYRSCEYLVRVGMPVWALGLYKFGF